MNCTFIFNFANEIKKKKQPKFLLGYKSIDKSLNG